MEGPGRDVLLVVGEGARGVVFCRMCAGFTYGKAAAVLYVRKGGGSFIQHTYLDSKNCKNKENPKNDQYNQTRVERKKQKTTTTKTKTNLEFFLNASE